MAFGLVEAGFPELETDVETALVVGPAAGVAGGGALEGADAEQAMVAGRTTVEELAPLGMALEREIVAAGLPRNAEFRAGAAPFPAVGGDAAAAGAVGSHEVGEFVAEGAVDFGLGDVDEAGVQFHHGAVAVGATGGGAETGVPNDGDAEGEGVKSEAGSEVSGEGGQAGVWPGRKGPR